MIQNKFMIQLVLNESKTIILHTFGLNLGIYNNFGAITFALTFKGSKTEPTVYKEAEIGIS